MRKAALAAMMAAWPTAARRGSSTPRGWGGCAPAAAGPRRTVSAAGKAATESIPTRIVAKLRVEKKGRGGKTVTVVDNLPNNAAFLKELCQDLKRTCGTGGTVADGAIELQGDLRDRVRARLTARGMTVKG